MLGGNLSLTTECNELILLFASKKRKRYNSCTKQVRWGHEQLGFDLNKQRLETLETVKVGMNS
jgi:hypothetical protein